MLQIRHQLWPVSGARAFRQCALPAQATPNFSALDNLDVDNLVGTRWDYSYTTADLYRDGCTAEPDPDIFDATSSGFTQLLDENPLTKRKTTKQHCKV